MIFNITTLADLDKNLSLYLDEVSKRQLEETGVQMKLKPENYRITQASGENRLKAKRLNDAESATSSGSHRLINSNTQNLPVTDAPSSRKQALVNQSDVASFTREPQHLGGENLPVLIFSKWQPRPSGNLLQDFLALILDKVLGISSDTDRYNSCMIQELLSIVSTAVDFCGSRKFEPSNLVLGWMHTTLNDKNLYQCLYSNLEYYKDVVDKFNTIVIEGYLPCKSAANDATQNRFIIS